MTSKFAKFMAQNKVQKTNGRYAPTASLVDEDGKPLEWEFKHISSKENERLRDSCTVDVQITGKPNLYRPRVNTAKYLNELIVASTVVPDLYDADLQDSYGVKTPQDLVFAMVDDPGEYDNLQKWVSDFQGFTKTLQDKVDEAKN